MKLLVIGITILAALGGAFTLFRDTSQNTFPPLSGVDNFNTTRYLGTWYEISTIPYFWEYLCYGTKAIYSLKSATQLSVENQCNIGSLSGTVSTFYGEAHQQGEKPSELCVTFNVNPVCAKYWIIDIADDYSWAVIGEPSRIFLWVLSRTPTMDETLYESIVAKAKAQEFDVSKLKKTPQKIDI